MKKFFAALLALALLMCAGCAKKPEPVVIDADIAAEPDAPASDAAAAEPAELTNVTLTVRRGGAPVSERSVTEEDELRLAERIVLEHLVISAAWPGQPASELEDCICLSFSGDGGTARQDYYQYDTDGRHVLQAGETGYYTIMTDDGYAALLRLAGIEEPEGAAEAVPTSFADIIAQYADAAANDYYRDADSTERDAAFGEAVALEWRINPAPVFYALHDLDGDGSAELFLGAGEDPAALTHYDLWCAANGKALRPFGMDFGGRVNFEPLADGVVMIAWSDSAFSSGYDFYRIRGAAAEKLGSLTIEPDPADAAAMRYRQDGAPVGEAAFERQLQQFRAAGRLPLRWLPVAAAD